MDPAFLTAVADHDTAVVVTPKLFQHSLVSRAREAAQHIVLPEGNDPRVVSAAAELLMRGLCRVTLLGNPAQVQALAVKLGVSLEGATVLDPHVETTEEMVSAVYEARKKKGMTREKARELLEGDENWFGTAMMYLNVADGMVSGACHSTAATMRPALQLIKMAPGFNIVSSVFFMLLPTGVKVVGVRVRMRLCARMHACGQERAMPICASASVSWLSPSLLPLTA